MRKRIAEQREDAMPDARTRDLKRLEVDKRREPAGTAELGNALFCRWDTKLARSNIALVEPNDLDWQPLDVVTRTSLSINFSAQTFQHRHCPRQLRPPPWTEIGPEVARW